MADYDLANLKEAIASTPPVPAFHGRGVVMVGGGKYLATAYVGIRSLRHSGSQLPVQLWYLGPEEMPDVARAPFEDQGVELVDAFEVQKKHPFKHLLGWTSKIFSVLNSHFEQVMFLDADNFVLENPDRLFQEPGYKEAGAIFWPDFVFESGNKFAIKPYAWEFLGLPSQENAELEAGQMLINKAQCWEALWLARHMNDEAEFYYNQCTYGDKDTYRLAWSYLNRPMYVIPHRPVHSECDMTMQHAPDGTVMFQHSRKWRLPVRENRYMKGYIMEDEALDWLMELQRMLQ